MVLKHLVLELQTVLGFYMYWEWNMATLEESSVLLTAKVFSNPSFLFSIVSCSRQPNHGQPPGADVKDLKSSPNERISLT